jgi:hypothetical protein
MTNVCGSGDEVAVDERKKSNDRKLSDGIIPDLCMLSTSAHDGSCSNEELVVSLSWVLEM